MKPLFLKFGIFDWLVLIVTIIFFVFALFIFKHAFSAWAFCVASGGIGWTLKTIFNEPKIKKKTPSVKK